MPKTTVGSGEFHIYDQRLSELTDRFWTAWRNSLSFSHLATILPSGDFKMTSGGFDDEEWARFNAAFDAFRIAYDEWLGYIHENYGREIDLEETNRVAHQSRREIEERMAHLDQS